MQEFDYDVYVDETLMLGGFKPEELTEEQKYLLIEPSEAPENYMCDGEITPQQAHTYWLKRLKKSGLTTLQIHKARKMNGL